MKANRIILWLEEELNTEELPHFLKILTDHGLEIHTCKDLRSYKKLIPSLLAFPEDIIITIDDDVIYEPDTLERLITTHLKYPNFIIGNRCAKIRRFANGKRKSYSKWENPTSDTMPSFDIVPIGIEGVLYPPHSLNQKVTDSDIFMKISPTCDDLWFKAMAKLNNTKACLSQIRPEQTRQIVEVPEAIFSSLYAINELHSNYNDTSMNSIENYFDITI